MKLVVFFLSALLLFPGVTGALKEARSLRAQSNLRQVGLVLHEYAREHGGRLPDAIEELVEEGYLSKEMFKQLKADNYKYKAAGKSLRRLKSDDTLIYMPDLGLRLCADGNIKSEKK